MASSLDQQPAQEAPNAEPDFSAAFQEAIGGEPKPGGDEPPGSEPAPAGSDEAPAHAAVEGSTSGEALAFDPWGGLTPEQKAYFERVAQSERSQRGRLGALTKKTQTLQEQLAAIAAKPEGEQGSDGKEATVSELQQRLDKSVDEYGDVVGPLVEALKEVQGKIDAIEKPAAKSDVDADAEVLTQAYGELERDHPDYAAVAGDQRFQAWLVEQPEKVVALANSFDPTEVSLVLTKFKAERSAAVALQSGNSGTGQQDSTATDDKRRRQLEGSRAVSPRGAPAAAGVPDDFAAAFKARADSFAK